MTKTKVAPFYLGHGVQCNLHVTVLCQKRQRCV